MAEKKNLTPEQRSLRARVAAYTMHSKHDSRQTSAAGRAAAFSKFEREVDPDGVLDPDERARRAAKARQAHMTRIAYRSAIARRKGAA